MPLKELPKFKAIPNRMLDIPNPGMGGLNLSNLEYELNNNQSPYMLNMMYRNGAFCKRYGQDRVRINAYIAGEIHAITYFNNKLIVHKGTELFWQDDNGVAGPISENMPNTKGLFFEFNQSLYYLFSIPAIHTRNTILYEYKYVENSSTVDEGEWVFGPIEPYVPTVIRGLKPDGSNGQPAEAYNILSAQYSMTYNGDGTTNTYKVMGLVRDAPQPGIYGSVVKVEVNGVEIPDTEYRYVVPAKTISFNTAPSSGEENVVVTMVYRFPSRNANERLGMAKYAVAYGGNKGSRVFLAGCGNSMYFWSDSFDATYFPTDNYAKLGNSLEDITGFGLQYNILIVFKPREVYSLTWYTQNESSTIIEEEYGLEAFKTQLVNSRIGCDAPNSIQLINNQLVWFNSNFGVCCLVSTAILDERNVRVISKNIERTNNMGVKGILDYKEDLNNIHSADFESKYFLVFGESGMAYVWDYGISPYSYYTRGETNITNLSWFLFDKFYVRQFLNVKDKLYYLSSWESGGFTYKDSIITLNDSFLDLSYETVPTTDPTRMIRSYYMTPFFQFDAVEYLKNIKELFIQCRGDTASVINIWYYTDAGFEPEQDDDPIRIGGRLWHKFEWTTFQWLVVAWAYTFRRKCNLKKIQMASFYFENNEEERDMSITHLGLSYQVIKTVR